MRGSACRLGDVGLHPAGETEITDFNVVEFGEENVFWLEVAVANCVGMEKFKAVDDLAEEFHACFDVETLSCGNEIKKLAVFGIFQDNVQVILGFAHFDEFQKMGMIKKSHKCDFTMYLSLKLRVFVKMRFLDNLDGDAAPGLAVLREFDLTGDTGTEVI